MNPSLLSAAAPSVAPAVSPLDTGVALVAATKFLLADLERGSAIDAHVLRTAMTTSFGASDSEGAWTWKTAYDACEAAQILFLRKFGRAMRERAESPLAFLAILAKVAALLPSHTRRSEESQALQQFSTPIRLGFVACAAAAITPADVVLEPSAGTGLLAIHAELAGGSLVLNELADTRAGLLDGLFPCIAVTRHDAAHIHDHLDAAVHPTVVLLNPPFSVAAHVAGRVADAALRHISSALARLAEGGRLVAITGANLSPDNSVWRDAFVRLQEHGRIVFSAAVDGHIYARHGTSVDTRLTVIDRVPADDPTAFPDSPGMASDTVTLLEWVTTLVPARPVATLPAASAAAKASIAARRATARPLSCLRSNPAAAIAQPTDVELVYEAVDWAAPQDRRITEANSFANEGFMDELAVAANADPAEYRLRYLKDQRAIDVLQAATKLANWQARPGPNPNAGSGSVVKGRGIAYLRYSNAITYVAAVAEVEVNKDTGEIRVTRICASHDCGEMVNPDGVANQVEGGVLQTVSRTLMETVTWDRNKVKSVDWVSYPIMRHTQAPKVEIALIDRPGTVAWGAGEPTACAIPAAIANAVFDARSVPFTPDKVKTALAGPQPQRG